MEGRTACAVIYNVEHLLDAAADVAALLQACPTLSVLATSRAPLHIAAEREYALGPLPLPSLDHVPTAQEVASAEAARLFVDRASAHAPGFTLTDANAAAVAAICRRLDGLPLALELAAGWIRMLPPSALLARLDDALPLLVGGARDLPERQRTMRDVVGWSYDLLEPAERRLFDCLAVFSGRWTIEAAQAVADPGDDPIEVLRRHASLLDRNLIAKAMTGHVNDYEL